MAENATTPMAVFSPGLKNPGNLLVIITAAIAAALNSAAPNPASHRCRTQQPYATTPHATIAPYTRGACDRGIVVAKQARIAAINP